MNQKHHTIDYIEIPVTDMAEAKRFYAEAFGWESLPKAALWRSGRCA